MEKLYFFIAIIMSSVLINAQVYGDFDDNFRLSINIGTDAPTLSNKTPYLDYKIGYNLGVNVDYYWTWLGLGLSFQHLNNNLKSTFPTDNLYLNESKITSTITTNEALKRSFIGFGANFKYNNTDRFETSLKLRAGISSFSGAAFNETLNKPFQSLNKHQGYKHRSALSAKAQFDVSYFMTDHLGLSFGAYYLQHFKVKSGLSAYNPTNYSHGENHLTSTLQRTENLEHEAHSVGIFAGLVYRFGHTYKAKKRRNIEPTHQIQVVVKDHFSKEIIPNAEVVLINSQGQRSYFGKTDKSGVATFNNVKADDYELKGKFREINLVSQKIKKTTILTLTPLIFELENKDERFVIEGKVTDCNNKMALAYATVQLKNETTSSVRNIKTLVDGTFSFTVTKDELYSLYGKKGNYFSQTERLDNQLKNRTARLFVNLLICMEETSCDKVIKLNNINYDFDKAEIRTDARAELDKLLQFLNDNTSIRIELSSHTDSRGSDDYNLKLSQARADVAVTYLIANGISSARITAKGYGETKLLNACKDYTNCSEEEHQRNRRTELKIVCNARK